MNNKQFKDLINCPVCKKQYWPNAIKTHIRGSARMEVYDWYISGRKTKIPHQEYIEKKETTIVKKTFTV